jgi:glycosyltransferase involved in cell wall biosynthesis
MVTHSDSETAPARRPGLTVAVPTYNGAAYLAETLRSILAQTEVSFDLILCDDQSTDETVRIAQEICGERVRIFINQVRLGLAGNWNACVERSETEWVAIVHQDDLLRPAHFAAQMALAAREPSLGLIVSAAEPIDARGNPIPPGIIEPGGLGAHDRLFAPGELLPLLAISNPLRCSAVSIRAVAHRAVRGFDPSFRYVVDWDFWIRLSRSWPIGWLAQPTVSFRWHLASETHSFKTSLTDLEETERLLTSLHTQLDQTGKKLAKPARRRLARAYLNRAYEAAKSRDRTLMKTAIARAWNQSHADTCSHLLDLRLLARLGLCVVGRKKF